MIRSAQAIRHWAAAGCAVVVHVDTAVTASDHNHFLQELADLTTVLFCARHRCEWGTWGMIAATQAACEMMLAKFADPRHFYLASGSCLPIRPVQDLIAYLGRIFPLISPSPLLSQMFLGASKVWTRNGFTCAFRLAGNSSAGCLTLRSAFSARSGSSGLSRRGLRHILAASGGV